jgi:hypothetical protein
VAIYLCRWTAEFVSLVVAKDESAVLAALDEIADPSAVDIKGLSTKDAVVTFHAAPDGSLSLAPEEWQTATLFQVQSVVAPTRPAHIHDEDP